MSNAAGYFTKHNVYFHEYQMHKYIAKLGLISNVLHVPRIVEYNEETRTLIMERVNNMNVADFYGENIEAVDTPVVNKIRAIISFLHNNHIIYPDITGYNFIEHENKIWIIDFEHATFAQKYEDPFVQKFIEGLNAWNPRFA
jgi:tRNA A-37 threonylcarbamoyl transferase component Bud32